MSAFGGKADMAFCGATRVVWATSAAEITNGGTVGDPALGWGSKLNVRHYCTRHQQ